MIAAIKYFSLQERVGTLLRWVDSLGNWGPAAFILIYIAGCVLFVPGSALTLGAGILFGVLRGSIRGELGSMTMIRQRH